MSHTMQDINISGTFYEYMKSVEVEVQRQLGCDYIVGLKNMGERLWSTDSDVKTPTYMVEIFDNEGWRVHFIICKIEFDRNMQSDGLNEFEQHKQRLKSLIELARIRFVDAEWSLKRAKERAIWSCDYS